MKKILIVAAAAMMLVGCGKDRYAEINTNPNAITAPDPSYLLLAASKDLTLNAYTEYFYAGNRYIRPWSQMTVGDRGAFNEYTMFSMTDRLDNVWNGAYNGVGGKVTKMQYVIDNYSASKKATYTYMYNVGTIMKVYMALKSTDYRGGVAYSEAFKALDYDPTLEKPVYDEQEALLKNMNEQLKAIVTTLSNPVMLDGKEVAQATLSKTQDQTYAGDYDKWASLANTLRLRIALRLVHADINLAKTIATEVVASGKLFESTSDGMWFYFGDTEQNNDGLGSGAWPGVAGKNFIEFLKANKDPRVRFFFSKNGYNASVLNEMLAQGLTLPTYIQEQAVIENGKFIRWKSAEMGDGDQYLGEPWVRYQGIPEKTADNLTTAEKEQYNIATKFQITVGKNKRTFYPYSSVNYWVTNPKENFVYPGVKATQDQYKHLNAYPTRMLLVSAAESKLILSLFQLLGVNTGKTANELFQAGVQNSVEAYDQLVEMHNAPYYKDIYDKTTFVNASGEDEIIEKPIGLQAGEIAALLTQDAYTLTGDHATDVEKVFVQLMADYFTRMPDLYAVCKLGGIPKSGSTVLPRALFKNTAAEDAGLNIPRRLKYDEPEASEVNFANEMASYQVQGFEPVAATDPSMDQRVWYDKNSPAWGAGPGL